MAISWSLWFVNILALSASVLPIANALPTHNALRGLSPSIHKAISDDFPDPSIRRHNSTYYSFATTSHGKNVQIARSTNLKDWHILQKDAMPHPGAWVDASNPAVWAPDVIQNEYGEYVLYYSAAPRESPGQHCVGAATSQEITGPYAAKSHALFCDLPAGGAIDASGFQDIDGQRYVLYKVDGNSVGHGGLCNNGIAPIVSTPIMLQPIGPNGMTKPQGDAPVILDRGIDDGPLVEAPSLVRTAGGKYVLFYSSSCFASPEYDVKYAVANRVEGPIVRQGALFVTGTQGLEAPGGASVSADGRWLVFHAGPPIMREMYVAGIEIDKASGKVRLRPTW